jgi:hypothetical protein
MKRAFGGPFSNDTWSIVECETLIETFNPDTAVIFERGMPFTHIWFSSKVERVIHPACNEYASSSDECKRIMGNMELWHNISEEKICTETNSDRPTLFYISETYNNDTIINKICSNSKDWILFIKGESPLRSSMVHLLEMNHPGYVLYYEPIKPEGDPRAAPAKRAVVISPCLSSKAKSLWSYVDNTPRSTATRMLTIQPPSSSSSQQTIKLTATM